MVVADADLCDKVREKLININNSFMISCNNCIQNTKDFLSLFKESEDWKEKFEPIVLELESIRNAYSHLMETCKSYARQQSVHLDLCCKQFKIIQNIMESANDDLEESHYNSIQYAISRIAKSLLEIDKLRNTLNETIVHRDNQLKLQQKILENKIEINFEAKKKLLEHANKHKLKYVMGAAGVGCAVGAACGAGLLLADILGGVGVCCVFGSFIPPAAVVIAPLAIGVIMLGGLAYGIIKYLNHRNRHLDKIEELDQNVSKFRESHEKVDDMFKDLIEYHNSMSTNLDDLKSILEDTFQKEFLLNSETIANTIEIWQNMQSVLDKVINFQY